jgi:hypothetical protein
MIDRTEQLADYEKLQATVARLRAREDEAAHAGALAAPVRLLADADGRVLWSDAALALVPGTALGAHVTDPSALAAALVDGSLTWIELRDAAGRTHAIALRPARDAEGNVLQYVGMTADPAAAR